MGGGVAGGGTNGGGGRGGGVIGGGVLGGGCGRRVGWGEANRVGKGGGGPAEQGIKVCDFEIVHVSVCVPPARQKPRGHLPLAECWTQSARQFQLGTQRKSGAVSQLVCPILTPSEESLPRGPSRPVAVHQPHDAAVKPVACGVTVVLLKDVDVGVDERVVDPSGQPSYTGGLGVRRGTAAR